MALPGELQSDYTLFVVFRNVSDDASQAEGPLFSSAFGDEGVLNFMIHTHITSGKTVRVMSGALPADPSNGVLFTLTHAQVSMKIKPRSLFMKMVLSFKMKQRA